MDDLDGLLEDLEDSSKAKRRPKAPAKKAAPAEDEWGDFGFDDPAPPKRAGTAAARTGLGQQEGGRSGPARQNSFGFGGPDGLKKEPKKAADDEEDWGIGDNKSGGRLLGRKPKREEEDDDELDNLLDGMVGAKDQKKQEPEAPKARPRTAVVRPTAARDTSNIDGLEDVDDAASQAPSGTGSQRGANDPTVAARRRALFGGPSGAQADAPKPARRAQTTTRPAPAQPEKPATPFGAEQPALGDGNASIGSQGSGIELLEVPNSRARRRIRPPAAASASRPSLGLDASGTSNPPTLRPPSGPESGVDQIQELHQNNRLVRPDTGNRKPPRGGAYDAAGEEGATLDLLAESQHA